MYSAQHNAQSNETDIKVGEILTILKRYRFSIVAITLSITLLAAIMAYFSPDIYRASVTFDITSSKDSDTSMQPDILAMASGYSRSGIDADIAMLKSTFLANKALRNLNLGTRYFTKERYGSHELYRTEELYKASPFVVATRYLSRKAEGVKFQLIPVNEEMFELVVDPSKKKMF